MDLCPICYTPEFACDCDYDEMQSYYESEDDEGTLGEFFIGVCGTPFCLMPGPHFASECHTAEDIEAYQAECEGG